MYTFEYYWTRPGSQALPVTRAGMRGRLSGEGNQAFGSLHEIVESLSFWIGGLHMQLQRMMHIQSVGKTPLGPEGNTGIPNHRC